MTILPEHAESTVLNMVDDAAPQPAKVTPPWMPAATRLQQRGLVTVDAFANGPWVYVSRAYTEGKSDV